MTRRDPLPLDLERLDPRAIPYDRSVRFIRAGVWLLLLVVLSAVAYADLWLSPTLRHVIVGVWLAGIALEVALALVMPPLKHRYTGFRVDERGIEIHSGVLWRSVATVARSRIQHLDVTQGPLERRYGLGRLHIHTAGTQFAVVALHGVAHERAKTLRDDLGAWLEDADGV